MSNEQFIEHRVCPACGSGTGPNGTGALAIYDDGHGHCFVCEKHWPEGSFERASVMAKHAADRPLSALPDVAQPIAERHLDAETVDRFDVTVDNDPLSNKAHVYPYFNVDGVHVANKIRVKGQKSFYMEGDVKTATLFGQNLFPAASAQAITLTEGELDAMSVYQMTGSKYPAVSILGASSAVKDCTNSFEYLNSFPKIVIAFDNDEPGKAAALKVAALFPIGKVHILHLQQGKDASDYLKAGLVKEFNSEWWKAPTYTPSGLRLGKDLWDEVANPKVFESVPYPWASLNQKTYGIRLGEAVLVTADTGVGKTTFLREIEYHLLETSKYGVGIIHLEESNGETALGLMSIDASKPLHLPDVRASVSPQEFRTYFDRTVNTSRVVVWDHFGSNSISELLAKIHHMHNLGCKYIILDHLSILVSDQSGDERKQLDEISTKLKTLCMELNIALIAAIHINRRGLIRGSAGPEEMANSVFFLTRETEDVDEWRRSVTKLVIKKNRFAGRTGPASYFYYNMLTGRLEELGPQDIERYEKTFTPEKKEW